MLSGPSVENDSPVQSAFVQKGWFLWSQSTPETSEQLSEGLKAGAQQVLQQAKEVVVLDEAVIKNFQQAVEELDVERIINKFRVAPCCFFNFLFGSFRLFCSTIFKGE